MPSSVFQSEVEEEVGLLNRAAPHSGTFFWFLIGVSDLNFKFFFLGPRPDLDPDIVAALDDDFNFDDPDNELEDDFVAAANGVPSDAETEYFSWPSFHCILIIKKYYIHEVTKKNMKQMKTMKTMMFCVTCEVMMIDFHLTLMMITNLGLPSTR